MNMWAPIDWLASFIQDRISTAQEQRIAVLSILLGLCLVVYGPFTSEPPVIYQMSAGALWIGGFSWLGALQAKKAVEDSD